jgi:large subunit ribosomal protein L3
MVEGLIGKKIGMSQTFDASGNVIPVTVIKAGPCTVIQKKIRAKDGYAAVQLGLVEDRGLRNPSKAASGHFKKSGLPPARIQREFRSSAGVEIQEGDQVFVDIFQPGEKVHVTGTSKGKGFQGVVTRHGFRGGRSSHGSMFHRAPGSIGASSYPSRVLKGTRMGGHMGQDRLTVRNLEVIRTDRENNLLLVRGAVPGPRGGYILIKKGEFRAESA